MRKLVGFTLIEVLIALSIFGVLVGGLIGFLPWATDGVAKIRDRSTALGMIDGIQIELERLGFSIVERGTKRTDGLYSDTSNIVDSQTVKQIILVAPRDGSKVSFEQVVERTQSRNNQGKFVLSESLESIASAYNAVGGLVEFDRYQDLPISLSGMERAMTEDRKTNSWNRWIDINERYFGIFCSQFAIYPQGESGEESRHFHHPSNGYLALQIEIQWPYKTVGKEDPIDEKFRNKVNFTLALAR